MGEHRTIVDGLTFFYEGAFVSKDLFKLITNYFYDKGYDGKPERDHQHDNKDGKHIEWHIAPWKKITDYQRLEIRVVVLIMGMTKKQVVVNKKKMTIDHSKVLIKFFGAIEQDYDTRWEEKPMFVFIRTLYDKFVFPMYTKRWESLLFDHVNQLYGQIEKFFNVYTMEGMGSIPPSTITHQDQSKS